MDGLTLRPSETRAEEEESILFLFRDLRDWRIDMPYGYLLDSCYLGYVEWLNRMVPFSTEQEYLDYIKED